MEQPAPRDDEVCLDVLAAGICGSELEGVRASGSWRVPPLVMGHEVIGRRADTGEVVAVNPLISCGACDMCADGAVNLCRRRQLIGVHRPGGFAERVVVPRYSCRPVPPELDLTQAVLAEPLANAVHALRVADRHLAGPMTSMGIFGAGTLGIGCALAAVARETVEVTIADLNDERLAIAATTLGVETGQALDGEFDVVIDAVGAADTRAAALGHLRPGGVSVWIGLHESDPGFDSLALVRQEHVVTGAFAYLESDFEAGLGLCAHAHPSWVDQVPLDEAATRFGLLLSATSPVPKTVILPATVGSAQTSQRGDDDVV